MRCELGEIEAALASHDGIEVAVAVASEGQVAGYYVAAAGGGADAPTFEMELQQWLRARLPPPGSARCTAPYAARVGTSASCTCPSLP